MVELHNSDALRSARISKSFLCTVPVGRTVQFRGYPFLKSLQEGVTFELYSSSHCVSLQICSNFPGNLIISIRETTRQILFRETHVHPENPKYATNRRCGHTTVSFNTKSCSICTYHWADTSKKNKTFKDLTPVP